MSCVPYRSLGDLERAVMDELWSRDALATVREVHAALAQDRTIAYTTAMTVLDRLARKGLVVQEREGRAFRYRVAASRSEMTAGLLRDTLADVEAEDRRSALVAFVGDATSDDLEALRAALADLDDE